MRIFSLIMALILFFLLFVFSAGAYADIKTKNVRGENLIIVQKDKLYGLNDKTTGHAILPVIYSDIKKIKYKNDTVFVGNYGFHKAFYSPDGFYDDFIAEYYSGENDIKYKNYPKNGSIIYRGKNGKTGVITVLDGILYVTDAVFDDAVYPDRNSLIAKNLKISFASPDKIFLYFNNARSAVSLKDYMKTGLNAKVLNGVILFPKADVAENINVSNNKIYSEYKNFDFSSDDFFAAFDRKTIANSALNITFSPVFKQNKLRLYSTEEFYELIEKTYNIELKNYPESFTIYDYDSVETVHNARYSELNDIHAVPYCNDSLLNTITGLKISFQNPDIIISKNDGKYGITDRYDRVRVPFVYDKLLPLECNTSEKISVNPETKRAVITYEGNNNDGRYFIASRKKYDVETGKQKRYDYLINIDNDILVTFEDIRLNDSDGLERIASATADITKSDINAQNRKTFFRNLPGYIAETALSIVLLPFMLIGPEFGSLLININYH